MKKTIACIILALILVTALCGCGSNRIDNGTTSNSQTVAPSANPYTSPAIDDGIVDDRDGILEDDNASGSMNGGANSGSGTGNNGGMGSNAGGSTGNNTSGTSGNSGSTGSGSSASSNAGGSASGSSSTSPSPSGSSNQ